MKILLVCNAGMSTSILVREMEKAAKEQQLELELGVSINLEMLQM